MKKDNLIQDELNQLDVNDYPAGSGTPYQVPSDYFAQLPEKMLALVLRPDNVETELSDLSPLLLELKSKNPLSVPEGYFEGLAADAAAMVTADDPHKELRSISPLLASLSKKMPNKVPADYFKQEITHPAEERKVIKLKRRRPFLQYAAAAVVALLIAVGILIEGRPGGDQAEATDIASSLKNVSTKELNEFLEMSETSSSVAVNTAEVKEVNDFLKNINDTEIKELIDDAETLEEEDLDIFLN